MSDPDHIGDWLIFLNRKERYFVVKQALGGFSLHESFRDQLASTLGLGSPRTPAYSWTTTSTGCTPQ